MMVLHRRSLGYGAKMPLRDIGYMLIRRVLRAFVHFAVILSTQALGSEVHFCCIDKWPEQNGKSCNPDDAAAIRHGRWDR